MRDHDQACRRLEPRRYAETGTGDSQAVRQDRYSGGRERHQYARSLHETVDSRNMELAGECKSRWGFLCDACHSAFHAGAGAGHLIYISSISGVQADVSGAAYQASKRGVVGLAHAIRMEEKQNGIRTCVICPGLVNTELLDKRPVKPSPEELAKALQAEDVAETILHVAKLPTRASIPELILLPATQ